MTKEELEKEADEWLCNNLHSASEEDFIKAMVDFAEPREKRIEELEKETKVLTQNFEDSEIIIAGLKSQIEKLKCCYNCRHSRTEYEHCRTDKHEKWEVKEK